MGDYSQDAPSAATAAKIAALQDQMADSTPQGIQPADEMALAHK